MSSHCDFIQYSPSREITSLNPEHSSPANRAFHLLSSKNVSRGIDALSIPTTKLSQARILSLSKMGSLDIRQQSLLHRLLLLCILIPFSNALRFDLVAGTHNAKHERCVRNFVGRDQLVVVTAIVSGSKGDGQLVNMHIKDSLGNEYARPKDVVGETRQAFTSPADASFDVCFSNELVGRQAGSHARRSIELDIDIGADARDWDAIKVQEKLKPVEADLRRIEAMVGEIVTEMDYMRLREQKLRDTNESTNERVKWFAFGTMGMLLGLGAWQVVYLRAYFSDPRRTTMSLSDLKPNGLYILLFLRNDPPIPNDFHWGLYFHRHPVTGGTKYHIRQPGSGWIADHGPTAGIFLSFNLVGLFRIADVPPGLEAHIDRTLRTYDDRLNGRETTCRVWLFWVLELLRNGVVVRCGDLEELEREVKEWGNENAMSAAKNEQPRPFAASAQYVDVSDG
ncbi:vesicle coat component [Emydomyces testavorans]|uniref:Vesicle coat component n=1 Tax=Emydomyces testavorans TaxID=2070801 RepID=A0AAF0DQ28_9EURO|nr:vesicle coat component [Emydomyces testavorans]